MILKKEDWLFFPSPTYRVTHTHLQLQSRESNAPSGFLAYCMQTYMQVKHPYINKYK